MEPKMTLRTPIKLDRLHINQKTRDLLIANGILSLNDLVKRISEMLSKKSNISLKDATIEFLLNLRRFGRDEADDLMKELKNIRFFEMVDWDKEVEKRKKEQEKSKERKEAKKLSRGEE